MLEFIFIVFISAIVLAIYKYRKAKPNTDEKTANEIITAEQEQIFPYKKKNLFTKNEYRFYMQLIKVTNEENMVVFPKVRLEDFIETTSADQKLKYRGYIKSRHVDFLICNKNLHIVAAIELDDPSHYNKKTRETDSFKNNLFKAIGIPLHRVAPGSDYNAAIEGIVSSIKTINSVEIRNAEASGAAN